MEQKEEDTVSKGQILRLLKAVSNEVECMNDTTFRERFSKKEAKFRSFWKPLILDLTIGMRKSDE